MTEEYQIAYVEKPEDSAWGIIGHGISDYNDQQAGDQNAQQICYCVFGPDQEIVGGVLGAIFWDWLYIDLMWIKDGLRGRGFGRQLLTLIEDEGRRRAARFAHLDTFSFQAPGFYQKHGYRVFGELHNFPAGHTRYYLTKEL